MGSEELLRRFSLPLMAWCNGMLIQIQPDLVQEFLQKFSEFFVIAIEPLVQNFEHIRRVQTKVFKKHLFFHLKEWRCVINSKLCFNYLQSPSGTVAGNISWPQKQCSLCRIIYPLYTTFSGCYVCSWTTWGWSIPHGWTNTTASTSNILDGDLTLPKSVKCR